MREYTGLKTGTRHTRRSIELIRRVNRPHDFVLDIGAGSSPYRRFLKGFVLGVDIHVTPFVDVRASVETLPFCNEIADGITCFQVLYYLPKPSAAISELARVLKPGGWIAMSVSRSSRLKREATRCCKWPADEWNAYFVKNGLMCHTPFMERCLFRHAGAYLFGLFIKVDQTAS